MCVQPVMGTVTVCMDNSCEHCTKELPTAADYSSVEEKGVGLLVAGQWGGGGWSAGLSISPSAVRPQV